MNTTVNLSEILQRFYDEVFLEFARETLIFDQFAQKRPLPKFKGTVIQFQRYLKLALATTALTEGTNPSGSNISAENVSATVAEYGDFVKLSSLVSRTAMDKGVSGKVEILGEQCGETFDRLISDEIAVNGTAQMVSTAANIAAIVASDVMTMTDIKLGVRNMKNANAHKFKKGYYALMIDPDVEMDLLNDDLFVKVNEYQKDVEFRKGEIGKWFGTRVFVGTAPYRTDTDGTVNNVSGAVHYNILTARNAYGITELEGAKQKIILKNPGNQDTSNPLNMYSTCGWYLCFVAKILNSTWIRNIKTGATG